MILHYRLPNTRLVVFGKNEDKLENFSFVQETYNIADIPQGLELDHAFECVGGEGSQRAIDQIIDTVRPEATVSILGVSENPVPVNTRMILEKGLVFFGSSRSGRKDFVATVEFMKEHPESVDFLSYLVGQSIEVENISDMNQAFEMDIQKSYGKTVMVWKA